MNSETFGEKETFDELSSEARESVQKRCKYLNYNLGIFAEPFDPTKSPTHCKLR